MWLICIMKLQAPEELTQALEAEVAFNAVVVVVEAELSLEIDQRVSYAANMVTRFLHAGIGLMRTICHRAPTIMFLQTRLKRLLSKMILLLLLKLLRLLQ